MRFTLMAVLLLGAQVAAGGDKAACEKIGTNGVQMKVTGYAFAKDTPTLYAFGDRTCTWFRDETAGGQPRAVYREQYKGAKGSTDATIWISRSTGRLVREEQDGDITGKGKGHISYQWPAKS
jgi:hypothetical protein